jgi:spore coat protein U-like protein
MKKSMSLTLVVTLVVTVVISVMAGSVFAGTITPTVSVTGTVSAICTVGTTGSLAFTINPSLAGPITATVTDETVFCTKGDAFTVTAASANAGGSAATCYGAGITGTLKDTSSDTMSYTFTCNVYNSGGTPSNSNAGTGQGFGTGQSVRLGMGGSIASTSYQNAPVGTTYADTINLTITY